MFFIYYYFSSQKLGSAESLKFYLSPLMFLRRKNIHAISTAVTSFFLYFFWPGALVTNGTKRGSPVVSFFTM